jgi:predicted dehydrogenase
MVGVGIVGCGHWGPNHIRNFLSNQRSQVVGVADTDPDTREQILKRFPGLTIFCDTDQMLSHPGIEAVVVATPTRTHYAIVETCLMLGKDVLCEKPLTYSTSEAKKLVALAAKNKCILMVGHTFLYNDGIRALKKYIDCGEIGAPLYIHLRRTNLGPIRRDVNVVYDLASHDIYIANYLLGGKPEKVYATGGTYLQDGLEDVAFITLRYKDKIMAHIHVSWLDPKKERQITVVGDKKMIVWDDLSSETIRIYNKSVEQGGRSYDSFGQFHLILKEGDIIIPKVNLQEPLANQANHFLDCIEQRIQPLSSGQNAIDVVDVLEKVQNSIQSN